ncbi:MAG: hypothetical protein ABIQ11_07615 [Saprospiraceae bacterium]
MNITKLLFAAFALFASFSLNAQVTGNPEIQKRLDSYIELTNQKKWSEAFDLLYPKMFTKVGKQELVDMMQTEDENGLSLRLDNRRITAFSAPFEENSETFVRIGYTVDMTVEIARGSIYDYTKPIQGMQQQFTSTYGENAVKWDAEAKQFKIIANKAMMAIKPAGKDWYLVEINTDQPQLMESLFSEAVLKALVRVE